ncbi:hypothetical protein AOC05_15885 [Arthrobacter alpinus]|uniref:Uncharacterized protein n=1 Tax=Arthrobacter alpinus TaxID=656366 RepID=A0A0M3UGP1_9MICC|nr:flagellar hook-length control protein FliK [Arthrobacter alpinus]ALE93455.1 hypothetical protein AOC05_15885 [Arthrobacter alpinus]
MTAVGAGTLLAAVAPARRASGGDHGQERTGFSDSLQGAVDAGLGDGGAVQQAPAAADPGLFGAEGSHAHGAEQLASWPVNHAIPTGLTGIAAPFTTVTGTPDAALSAEASDNAALVAATAVGAISDAGPATPAAPAAATDAAKAPAAAVANAPVAAAPISAAGPAAVPGSTVPGADVASPDSTSPSPTGTVLTSAALTSAALTSAALTSAVPNGAPGAAGPAPGAASAPATASPPVQVVPADGEASTGATQVEGSDPVPRDGVVPPKTADGAAGQLGTTTNPAVVAPSPAGVPTPPQQVPPTAAAAVVNQPGHPPLAEQLSRPIFALATGQNGGQIMTVQVVPDSLGPVTVRAHMAADGIRIELLAATDLGRDGLRLIMADLKRDLSGQGITSSLSLNPELGGGAGGSGQAFRGNAGAPTGTWNQGSGAETAGEAPPSSAPANRTLSTISLDITV